MARLPNRAQLDELKDEVERPSASFPRGSWILSSRPRPQANPMDVMRTAVSMLGLYDSGLSDEEGRAKVPTTGAPSASPPRSVSSPPISTARDKVSIFLRCERISAKPAHFLYLLNGRNRRPEAERTLDVAYVLHADHGMNASTFSARVTIATLSDIYSAITSAIGTLKGPLHGGANEGVIHMLLEIGSEDKVDAWIEEATRPEEENHGHRSSRLQSARSARSASARHGHQAL